MFLCVLCVCVCVSYIYKNSKFYTVSLTNDPHFILILSIKSYNMLQFYLMLLHSMDTMSLT